MGNADTLIACFSRSGENYRVGTIEKGNGMIIAEEAGVSPEDVTKGNVRARILYGDTKAKEK